VVKQPASSYYLQRGLGGDFQVEAVKVKDLKHNLSKYLKIVRAGEGVLVTDGGRVVAALRPAPVLLVDPEVPAGLQELARSGALRLGTGHDPAAYPSFEPAAPAGTAQALLDEGRAER